MELDDALRRLGLTSAASLHDVATAYRTAVKVVHDAGSDADGDAARDLNEAYDVARRALRTPAPGTDLITLDSRTFVELLQGAHVDRTRGDEVERTVDQVVLHYSGRMAQRRRARASVAILGAGIAAILAILRAPLTDSLFDHDPAPLALAIGGVGFAAVWLGVMTWVTASHEQVLKLDVAEAVETLGDRDTFVETLREIGMTGTWTREQLRGAVAHWTNLSSQRHSGEVIALASLAHRIGEVDFARLVIVKGLQQNLLREAEVMADGRVRFGYTLSVPTHAGS